MSFLSQISNKQLQKQFARKEYAIDCYDFYVAVQCAVYVTDATESIRRTVDAVGRRHLCSLNKTTVIVPPLYDQLGRPSRRFTDVEPPDLPTFEELCNIADDELFGRTMRLSNHVLHALIPAQSYASQRYNLRHRTHALQLPSHTTRLSDSNFITRMLYKDKY